MARYILITAIAVAGGRVLWPGTTVDSTQEDTTTMVAQGARLYVASNGTVAAAAEQAVQIKRRGGTINQAASVMTAAAMAADADAAAGGSPGPQGDPGPTGPAGKPSYTVTTAATDWAVNPGETFYVLVGVGTVDWAAVGVWVSLSDGTLEGVGTVYAIAPEDPEAPGFQVVTVQDHSTAGNPIGLTLASGAKFAPSGKPA